MKIIKPKPKLHKIAQVICQALKQTLNFYTFTKSLSSLLNSATSLMPLIVNLLSVLGLKCPGAEVSRHLELESLAEQIPSLFVQLSSVV